MKHTPPPRQHPPIKTLITLATLALIALTTSPASAFSSSPGVMAGANYTGSPGSHGECSFCHSGPQTVTPAEFVISGPRDDEQNLLAGELYTVSFQFSETPTADQRFGFQVTALNDNEQPAGHFISTPNEGNRITSVGSFSILEHRAGSIERGFEATWRAPSQDAQAVTFHISYVMANNDGSTRGDNAVTFTPSVHPVSQACQDDDGDGVCNEDEPPTTTIDTFFTVDGQDSVIIDVLDNDRGAAAPLNRASLALIGDITPAGAGTVSIRPDNGLITVTLAEGFTETLSFQYVIEDSEGRRSEPTMASVTVNDAPSPGVMETTLRQGAVGCFPLAELRAASDAGHLHTGWDLSAVGVSLSPDGPFSDRAEGDVATCHIENDMLMVTPNGPAGDQTCYWALCEQEPGATGVVALTTRACAANAVRITHIAETSMTPRDDEDTTTVHPVAEQFDVTPGDVYAQDLGPAVPRQPDTLSDANTTATNTDNSSTAAGSVAVPPGALMSCSTPTSRPTSPSPLWGLLLATFWALGARRRRDA